MNLPIQGEFPLQGEVEDIDFEILLQLPLSEVIEKVVQNHKASPGTFLELYGQPDSEPDKVYVLRLGVISEHKKQ